MSPPGPAHTTPSGSKRGQSINPNLYPTDCRWPVPELEVVNRAPRRNADRLRAVVFNAKGGRRLSALLESLKRPPLAGANVILLCDVDHRNKRSDYLEIASEIA